MACGSRVFFVRRTEMANDFKDMRYQVFKRILVPLDGSEIAEAVLELAKNLAVKSGSALTLLHVCNPDDPNCERLHSSYIERMANTMRSEIAKTCETVQCHFIGAEATASAAVTSGDPADEIVRYAEEIDASVILMSTHGRTGLVSSVMSDTANRVVRNSLIPVWLIRTLSPNEITCVEWPPARVVVPLDGSKRAEKVLRYAMQYAGLFDAEIVLLRVCEAPSVTADYPEATAKVSWEDHVKRIQSHYEGQCSIYLETVKDRLDELGLKVKIESLLGDAAEEIVKYIQQNRCDLVAMTTRGRSGVARWAADSLISRWLFSDVTEQVLAASSRGILLARGEGAE
jgi:nucleotide-binding universal stress UspA family protein